ncbi:hypothetical protein F4804DRAFT_315121 [Jackrogersella minutella]|nr:hypothetical protein F4804DRAFT_315121 [Jackrogersella minutella]
MPSRAEWTVENVYIVRHWFLTFAGVLQVVSFIMFAFDNSHKHPDRLRSHDMMMFASALFLVLALDFCGLFSGFMAMLLWTSFVWAVSMVNQGFGDAFFRYPGPLPAALVFVFWVGWSFEFRFGACDKLMAWFCQTGQADEERPLLNEV